MGQEGKGQRQAGTAEEEGTGRSGEQWAVMWETVYDSHLEMTHSLDT